MTQEGMGNRRAGGGTVALLPALGLFLVAPSVAEFLLGNMSIARLGLLGILAPLYGGGALLIRECIRRTGRGFSLSAGLASLILMGVSP